ncbi:lipoyl synthase [Buchnera aphidicola]|uniref:lipoyl synthase n=1 Tax=Buchnera aphidicola TaxID=9 RepID=UPI002092D708|nr:lipoyl synthase [Buchnera aphidicola]USS94309.1 lipoyl synthase [Buchnera aphidicola (Sipha maydis)]
MLNKPNWIKIKFPSDSSQIKNIKKILNKYSLNTVCQEAQCPNLTECFNNKTATFMILGSICTRKCPFCAVNKGRPLNIDKDEPRRLARVISYMNLKYVVITSVNRDDLKDGGSIQFLKCIRKIRQIKNIKIEILVPDFRRKINIALEIIGKSLPDVFNHNLENVPRLYNRIRPGANYLNSLKLLYNFNKKFPEIPTKSGLMVGLGETNKEIFQVMQDLYDNGVSMLTIGQYLQPSKNHFPVQRYVNFLEFDQIKRKAFSIGFKYVFCGPLVRSSYHAKNQYIKNSL